MYSDKSLEYIGWLQELEKEQHLQDIIKRAAGIDDEQDFFDDDEDNAQFPIDYWKTPRFLPDSASDNETQDMQSKVAAMEKLLAETHPKKFIAMQIYTDFWTTCKKITLFAACLIALELLVACMMNFSSLWHGLLFKPFYAYLGWLSFSATNILWVFCIHILFLLWINVPVVLALTISDIIAFLVSWSSRPISLSVTKKILCYQAIAVVFWGFPAGKFFGDAYQKLWDFTNLGEYKEEKVFGTLKDCFSYWFVRFSWLPQVELCGPVEIILQAAVYTSFCYAMYWIWTATDEPKKAAPQEAEAKKNEESAVSAVQE